MADRARRWPWVVLTLVLAAAGVAAGLHFAPTVGNEGEAAPDFRLETVEHGTVSLDDYAGRVLVLDLMAVNCASCRVTEQALLRLAADGPPAGIVSIDIWTTYEDEDALRRHMHDINATWPYAMDTDGMFIKYGAYAISKVVVVDAHGRIAWQAEGGIEYERLAAAVDRAASRGAEGGAGGGLGLGLVGFAVFAGIASFFAPCAFPLLPGYVAYSLSLDEAAGARPVLRRALGPGAAAAAGIFVAYGIFGVVAAVFGAAAGPWLPLLQPFIGVLAIVLGVALLAGFSMTRVVAPVQRGVEALRRRVTGKEGAAAWTGHFGYGLGYGAAAAGCTAPVFLQLALTAFAAGFGTGVKVFLIYAGVGALLMVTATLVAVAARGALARSAARVAHVVERASGVVLVAAGVYLIWFYDRAFGLLP